MTARAMTQADCAYPVRTVLQLVGEQGEEGDAVSTFANGKVWRARALNYFCGYLMYPRFLRVREVVRQGGDGVRGQRHTRTTNVGFCSASMPELIRNGTGSAHRTNTFLRGGSL